MTTLQSFASYARDAADADDADVSCEARRCFEDFVGEADTCLAPRDYLSITDWAGRECYLDTDDYAGPFDLVELDHVFFLLRRFLADAEASGCVYETLGRLGMSGKEEWWRVEATYFRAHFGHLPAATARDAFVVAAQADCA